MTKTNYIAILALLALLALSFWAGYSYNSQSRTYINRIDTVKVWLKPDTIILDSIRTKVTYRYKTAYDTVNKVWRDTIYQTMPFIARIDTATAAKDSVSLQYWFPEQIIKNLRVKPHEFEHITIVKRDTIQIMNEPKWYEKGLWFLGGMGIGIIGGVIICK